MKAKSLVMVLALAFLASLALMLTAGPAPAQQFTYEVAPNPGQNCSPTQALEMYLKDKANTVIVDVRTRAEYMFVGHPTMAVHLPIMFLTPYMGKHGWQLKENSDFIEDLKAKVNTAEATIIFMCRSGGRSALAVKKAVKAGLSPEKCYNMLGGFEGDKVKSKLSAYHGQRKLGGWRNEGLPWTYSIDPKLAYTKN